MARQFRPIRLNQVRQNNLKNITVEFPARRLSVITGLSGSGKSSLAFETLYAEGQRRYVESLSTYTRQFLEKMPKPDVESVENIPPAIALEQRNHVMNSRSTVGTQTEIVDYLRVLFAKAGETSCMDCGSAVINVDPAKLVDEALGWFPGRKAAVAAPLPVPGAAKPVKAKKSSKKSAKTTKSTTKTAPKKGQQSEAEVLRFLKLYREQGFRRIYWGAPPKKGSQKPGLTLDLDDLGGAEFPVPPIKELEQGRVSLIVDRFKITEGDSDSRSRLMDSIEQALRIGHEKVRFIDLDSGESREFECRFACVKCGRAHRIPEPNLFSFNSPIGACSRCSGFGHTLEIDESLVVPDPSRTLKNGAIDPLSKPAAEDWQDDLFRFAERHGISIGKRYRELTPAQRQLLWKGDPGDKTFPGILGFFEFLSRKKYKLHVRVFIRRYQSQMICPDCNGARLQPEALAVRINGLSMPKVLDLPVNEAIDWADGLRLTDAQTRIAAEILSQVRKRLSFLKGVGVEYLTLSRLAKTLSGGEFQRITLATQLGNGLCGTLYVLDEPSIGLHAADTERLIQVLHELRDHGNTVVVVEHDLDFMRQADWLVEIGPGAGRRGGELVAQGTPEELARAPGSLTGKYLTGAFQIERIRPPRSTAPRRIRLSGCRENNLKNLDVEFPLERFVVVTGVSGSGKSTLVHKTLYQALARVFEAPKWETMKPGRYGHLYGADQISGVVLLDQRPIGKSSRSNPATYLKAWDEVRRLFANQATSLRRGYTPQHFSFNVDGGRCPVCRGEGEITIDMHFMAEIKLPCEECGGKRFKRDVLDIVYRGKNVSQLLETTIDEAYDIFRDNPILVRKLGVLRDVGLGYLQVGQSATTLSGGESQRLKIAAALDSRDTERTLYLFDEPTTGLHPEDIGRLLRVIQDLVDAKHSVVMIEHHLDVIAQADWVIDLGPTGGEHGGHLVAKGTPAELAHDPESITGRMMIKAGFNFPSPRESIELNLKI